MSKLKRFDDLNGQEVRSISWILEDLECGPDYPLIDGTRAYLSVEYYGDRKEIWIVEVRDKSETRRHNIKLIKTITWAESESSDA